MSKKHFFEVLKKKIIRVFADKKTVETWQDKMREEIEKMGRFNSQLILMMK